MLKSCKMQKKLLKGIKSRISAQSSNTSSMQSPRSRLFLLVIGIVGLTIILALNSYTSKPEFCERCHEVKPAVNAWRTSLHAEVNCSVCHYTGTFGFVKQKTSLIIETFRHVTGLYEEPLNLDSSVNKKIDNNSCLECHTPKRVITPKKTLVMDHNVHLSQGIKCSYCHNRAGHPELSEHKNYISMEGCFRCHGLSNKAVAPGRCDACHPKSFDLVPATHKTKTWRIPDHGKTAKTDSTACEMCHQKTYCNGCHGVEVPHPDKFIKNEHGSIGTRNPQACQKCHRQKDFCNACHHKGYDDSRGGWVPTHKYVVADAGPAYCFKCHGPTFCASCHVRGELQPRTQRQQ